jgi:hypothetical protein
MKKIKTADKVSISNTEVKSTEIGLKETESNKAFTRHRHFTWHFT